MAAPRIRPIRPLYILGLLTLGYLLNSLDRAILSVLLEPIGREFDASDTQLGLLSGLAFAVVYALSGLPLATWADGGRHRAVLATGMMVWSAMTAACGIAPAFAWLLVARMGVAAGEAAGTPTSHALIAQHFPAERRATALSIYSIGASAGLALAGFLGGQSLERFGWRMTLMLAALPGLILATVLLLTTDDPPRRNAADAAEPRLSWSETWRALWPLRAYRHLWIGSALHCIALFGTANFNAAFLMRTLGWSAASAGALVGLLGIAGALGTFAGGWCADALTRRTGDKRWTLRIAALATVVAAPVQAAAYLLTDPHAMMIVFPLASFLANAFLGPVYAATQTFAPSAARSRSVAILMLAMTLVGLGAGPLLIGLASDSFSTAAPSDGLRYALLLAPLFTLWASAHFFTAARLRT